MNPGTIITLIILVIIIALIIARLIRQKKAGISSCGCKCSHCPNSSMCHSVSTKKS